MIELLGAVLGIALLVVKHLLTKEKTKLEKAEAATKSVNSKMISLKKKIEEGKLYDIKEELDNLDHDIRFLLGVHKKTGDKG